MFGGKPQSESQYKAGDLQSAIIGIVVGICWSPIQWWLDNNTLFNDK